MSVANRKKSEWEKNRKEWMEEEERQKKKRLKREWDKNRRKKSEVKHFLKIKRENGT